MLLFCDSFDHYIETGGTAANPNGFAQKYDNGTTGNPDIILDPRTGTAAVEIQNAEFLVKQIYAAPSTTATVCVGFALKRGSGTYLPLSRTPFLKLTHGTSDTQTEMSLCFDQNQRLIVRRGRETATGTSADLATSTNAISLVGYRYIEFRVKPGNGTAGSYEVRVDGVAIPMSTANPNTAADTMEVGTGISHVILDSDSGTDGGSFIIDDLYISDDSGANNTSFLGDVKVTCGFPTVDGTHEQWTPSTGSDSFAMVDDGGGSPWPDGDATNISDDGTVLPHKSTFTFTTLTGLAAPKAVQLVMSGSAVGATRTVKGMARIGGVDYDGDDTAEQSVGGTTYHMRREIWETNPAGGAWSIAGVNGGEFGVNITA